MNNRAVIKRIRKIEDIIVPQPREDVVVIWSFGSEDEPHGKFGYRKFHVYTGFKEVCTEEEEHEFLLEAYERIPLKARKSVEYWHSFEKFLEHRRCNCPVHRVREDSKENEIQNLLKTYDEVVSKVANRYFEPESQDVLNQEC